MDKEIEKFDDDDDLEEFDKNLLESEDFEQNAPVVRDYSQRQILIWEEDDARRDACLEVLTDLLVGATIKAVKTEAEALEQLESEDWDTFVVDFYSEGVSASEFIKRVNNYPGSILVAISMGPLTLPDERDPAKTELLRRLFDMDKPVAQLHG
jgi:DNA-binding NtrC family response regulator